MAEQKIDYEELDVGYEFPKTTFHLDSAMVSDYIAAVGETSSLYQDSKLVPPMAIAAFAMAALAKGFSLPSGAIHISQEIEFLGTIGTSDTITSHAKVSRKQKRSVFHLLTIDFRAFNQANKAILAGKTEFILPQSNIDSI